MRCRPWDLHGFEPRKGLPFAKSQRVWFGPCGSEIPCGAARLKSKLIRGIFGIYPALFGTKDGPDISVSGRGLTIYSPNRIAILTCGAAQVGLSDFTWRSMNAFVMINTLVAIFREDLWR